MGKSMLDGEFIVAVDFDGTVTTDPDISTEELVLRPECKRVLERLHENGVLLVLWTCRTASALDQAVEFLKDNDLLQVFTTINKQIPELELKYAPTTSRKVGADVYIDDKNIFCKGIDWLEIENYIYGEGGGE